MFGGDCGTLVCSGGYTLCFEVHSFSFWTRVGGLLGGLVYMYDMSEEYIWCTLQAMLDLIGLECLGLQCTTSPSTHGTSNHSFLAPSTSQLS